MLPIIRRQGLLALAALLAVVGTQHVALVRGEAKAAAEADVPLGEGMSTMADECRALGYEEEALDCRLCDVFESLVNQEPVNEITEEIRLERLHAKRVFASCKKCCRDLEALANDANAARYARVELEVCTCKFGRYPKVANFVHHHAAKHSRLEVKYLDARHPHLVFYDADGLKAEEVSIASWDEETISEFIESKLAKIDETESKAADASEAAKPEAEEEEEKEAKETADELDEGIVEVEVDVDGN